MKTRKLKINQLIICALIGLAFANFSFAEKYKSLKMWERCRDEAEASVSQFEVGISGVEAAIADECGEPPAKEPSLITGIVGMHPYDLVRSSAWKIRFVKLTKGNYKELVYRLTVASETELKGEWVVGKGLAPHMGGLEEAAFVINTETDKIFAAMMVDGNKFIKFGFSSWESVPPYLQEWYKTNKQISDLTSP